jgi:uncharacterized protein (TIGR03437 family)
MDFVCPMLEPGTPLEIVVETEAGKSNKLQSVMGDAAPGVYTVDGSGSGQAVAWRTGTSELSLIPSFLFHGKPALPGDQISMLVNGINCAANPGAQKPLVILGEQRVPGNSLRESALTAGACEVGFTVPDGVTGDAVPLSIEVLQSDGRLVPSNAAFITVENSTKKD